MLLRCVLSSASACIPGNAPAADPNLDKMKLSVLALTVVVVAVLGVPVAHTEPEKGPVCPNGLYSVPQCCATDVLGVANLDCQTREQLTSSGVVSIPTWQ